MHKAVQKETMLPLFKLFHSYHLVILIKEFLKRKTRYNRRDHTLSCAPYVQPLNNHPTCVIYGDHDFLLKKVFDVNMWVYQWWCPSFLLRGWI